MPSGHTHHSHGERRRRTCCSTSPDRSTQICRPNRAHGSPGREPPRRPGRTPAGNRQQCRAGGRVAVVASRQLRRRRAREGVRIATAVGASNRGADVIGRHVAGCSQRAMFVRDVDTDRARVRSRHERLRRLRRLPRGFSRCRRIGSHQRADRRQCGGAMDVVLHGSRSGAATRSAHRARDLERLRAAALPSAGPHRCGACAEHRAVRSDLCGALRGEYCPRLRGSARRSQPGRGSTASTRPRELSTRRAPWTRRHGRGLARFASHAGSPCRDQTDPTRHVRSRSRVGRNRGRSLRARGAGHCQPAVSSHGCVVRLWRHRRWLAVLRDGAARRRQPGNARAQIRAVAARASCVPVAPGVFLTG